MGQLNPRVSVSPWYQWNAKNLQKWKAFKREKKSPYIALNCSNSSESPFVASSFVQAGVRTGNYIELLSLKSFFPRALCLVRSTPNRRTENQCFFVYFSSGEKNSEWLTRFYPRNYTLSVKKKMIYKQNVRIREFIWSIFSLITEPLTFMGYNIKPGGKCWKTGRKNSAPGSILGYLNAESNLYLSPLLQRQMVHDIYLRLTAVEVGRWGWKPPPPREDISTDFFWKICGDLKHFGY